MHRTFIALAFAMSLSFAGALSPAQSVFNEVSGLLQTRYGGLSQVNRPDLIRQFQGKLDEACAAQGEQCPTSAAYPVIGQEIQALGDPHSFFMDPEDFKDFRSRASGGSRLQYGVKLGKLADTSEQVVTEVIPGSSAADAGLRRGDRLKTIDGQPYSFDALKASRSKGSPITLTGERGGLTFTVSLLASVSTTRDLPRIEYQDDVAVLRIPTFISGGGIGQAVHDLMHQAQAHGARGLLVDLRDNPGGELGECDMSISAFVPTFTRVARTAGGDNPTVVAHGAYQSGGLFTRGVRDPALWEGPMAVLVSKNSASCSEFFAREIQYAKRGPVIGEATAGVSNSATNVMSLDSDGQLTAVQLTTVHYVKPDGVPYPEQVKPDVPGTEDYDLLARGQDALLQQGLAAIHTAVAAGEHTQAH